MPMIDPAILHTLIPSNSVGDLLSPYYKIPLAHLTISSSSSSSIHYSDTSLYYMYTIAFSIGAYGLTELLSRCPPESEPPAVCSDPYKSQIFQL
jgi:hypothetical protein